jgi:hypothetical protein
MKEVSEPVGFESVFEFSDPKKQLGLSVNTAVFLN